MTEIYLRMFSMKESANSAPLSARAFVKADRSGFFSARSMMNSARSLWFGRKFNILCKINIGYRNTYALSDSEI